MKHILASLVIALISISQVNAEAMLSADGPVSVTAGGVSVGTITVSIVDPTVPAQDFLTSWTNRFWIEPIGGATGHVGFNSAFEPSPYILAGTLSGGYTTIISTMTTPSDALLAGDFLDTGETAPSIPTTPGSGLVEMDFFASGDASGSFALLAVGGLGNTEWGDGAGTSTEFTNIPGPTGTHTQIGTINVQPAIPEPTSLLVWGTLASVFWGFGSRRRRSR